MITNKNKYRLLGLEGSRIKFVHLWKKFALDTFWYLPNTGYVCSTNVFLPPSPGLSSHCRHNVMSHTLKMWQYIHGFYIRNQFLRN